MAEREKPTEEIKLPQLEAEEGASHIAHSVVSNTNRIIHAFWERVRKATIPSIPVINAVEIFVEKLLVGMRNLLEENAQLITINAELENERREFLANARNSQSISDRFYELNMGVGEKSTILEAVSYLDEAIAEKFPGVSLRLVLAPGDSETFENEENPIAQVLRDTLNLYEEEAMEDEIMKASRERYEYLAKLLPMFPGVLKDGSNPRGIHVLGNDSLAIFEQGNRVLDEDEIKLLDPKIFGTPKSARICKVPWIGWVVLFTDKDGYYNQEQDAHLLKQFFGVLGTILTRIGDSEDNKKCPLTKLPLRKLFDKKASRFLAAAKRERRPVTFAFIDGDKFKSVNDTYGHAMGDLVLVTIARLVRQTFRENDLFYRYGGEEFGVLMDGKPAKVVEAFKRFSQGLGRIHFQMVDGVPSIVTEKNENTFNVTVSVGLSTSSYDLDKLTKMADHVLMNEAKRTRNCVAMPDGSIVSLKTEDQDPK